MTNPWMEQHVRAEVEMQEGDVALARKLVESEFAYDPEVVPCVCGGTAHWRPTVGAMQCPSCRALYGSDGVGFGQAYEAEMKRRKS